MLSPPKKDGRQHAACHAGWQERRDEPIDFSGNELVLVLALFLRFEFAVSLLRAFECLRRSHGIAAATQKAEQGSDEDCAGDDH